ncbi:MAG TPA: right-handed parallel beta-helix repeat-containing protein [Opitutaceae bacterium]|nr:right-handed parallel beta-helix repeat-containing protein [Opitutaceae bacterium]
MTLAFPFRWCLLFLVLGCLVVRAQVALQVQVVDSLPALRGLLAKDGVHVRMVPGVYLIDEANAPDFLEFRARNAHFDLSGVTLKVDTALSRTFGKVGTNFIKLSGDNTLVEGFSLETFGNHPAPGGARAVSITGNRIVLRRVTLTLAGSSPYGYGSFFGIGAENTVSPLKLNGIRVSGDDNTVEFCHVFMRCFGHAIFLRGANRAIIKGCRVEGALRRTDQILAETSGVAYDQGFRQYTGEPIPAGEMTSLSEDGIRAYPDDPDTGRRTQNIRVENCRVSKMRRAICLAFAAGKNVIVDCEVTESERVGFHIGSHTTILRGKADALYAQALDISSSGSRESSAEILVIDSRSHYGNTLLAKINGRDHRVTLTEASADTVPGSLQIELASNRGFGAWRKDTPHAERIELSNQTAASVVLKNEAQAITGQSLGPVTDLGRGNSLRGPLPKHTSLGDPSSHRHVTATNR